MQRTMRIQKNKNKIKNNTRLTLTACQKLSVIAKTSKKNIEIEFFIWNHFNKITQKMNNLYGFYNKYVLVLSKFSKKKCTFALQ